MKNKIFECKNIDNDKTLITIANEFAKLYQPHDIFTLDIAKIKNSNGFDYKIIEYNCFNCSGIYETNFSKMANEIQNYLNHFN